MTYYFYPRVKNSYTVERNKSAYILQQRQYASLKYFLTLLQYAAFNKHRVNALGMKMYSYYSLLLEDEVDWVF